MSHERMQRMHRLQLSRSLTLITSMALTLVLWACDGQNFFQPSGGIVGGGGDPTGALDVEIQSPTEPAAAPVGDSVLIRVRVTANSDISSVLFGGVAFRGDPDLGTASIVARYQSKVVDLGDLAVEDTVLTRYLLSTPDSTRELVSLFVIAYDSLGNAASDSTSLFIGGPKVEFLTLENNQQVQAGLGLSLRVYAADPQGIISLRIDATGAFEESIVVSFNPPIDSTIVDTVMVIPSGAAGQVQLTATARNSVDIPGQDGPLFLLVVSGGGGDVIAPSISLASESPDPMELGDSVIVVVAGRDDTQGSGITRVGYTVLAISPSRGDTLVQSEEVTYDPARTGNISATLSFPPFNVDALSLPDTLIFEITAYAFDAAGNCAAAVGVDVPVPLPCATLAGGEVVADGRIGLRVTRSIVAGRTVMLPRGGKIMDAVVDTIRRNLLLSNIEESVIEVFRLEEEVFLDRVRVGSEPWGITMNRGEDTLVVANSEGTNLSNVYLGPKVNSDPPFQPFEDPGRRLLTPDVVLFDVEMTLDEAGAKRLKVTFIPDLEDGFSDLPQYVAVDSTGRILFSTRTTEGGAHGTIRKAYVPPGMEFTEVRLFYEHAALADAPDFRAVANSDGVEIVNVGAGDQIIIYDHIPGTDIPISGGPSDSVSGAGNAALAAGSDVWWGTGRWDVEALGFSDTTFVTASGDGGWVAFGEGSVDPIGRIIMYNAAADSITDVIQVTDLELNASETVRGLALNHDGTLGVARGDADAYFFSTDLRKQGIAELPGGGAGAALHPLHADYPSLDNYDGTYHPDTHLAFIGTGERTIDIVDAFHFNRIGRIFIRDVVAGPLTAVLPFPDDNTGFQCSSVPVLNGSGQLVGEAIDVYQDALGNVPWPDIDDDPATPTEDKCIVIKLFGVTSSGGVVVVDVRKGDILRDHPARG